MSWDDNGTAPKLAKLNYENIIPERFKVMQLALGGEFRFCYHGVGTTREGRHPKIMLSVWFDRPLIPGVSEEGSYPVGSFELVDKEQVLKKMEIDYDKFWISGRETPETLSFTLKGHDAEQVMRTLVNDGGNWVRSSIQGLGESAATIRNQLPKVERDQVDRLVLMELYRALNLPVAMLDADHQSDAKSGTGQIQEKRMAVEGAKRLLLNTLQLSYHDAYTDNPELSRLVAQLPTDAEISHTLHSKSSDWADPEKRKPLFAKRTKPVRELLEYLTNKENASHLRPIDKGVEKTLTELLDVYAKFARKKGLSDVSDSVLQEGRALKRLPNASNVNDAATNSQVLREVLASYPTKSLQELLGIQHLAMMWNPANAQKESDLSEHIARNVKNASELFDYLVRNDSGPKLPVSEANSLLVDAAQISKQPLNDELVKAMHNLQKALVAFNPRLGDSPSWRMVLAGGVNDFDLESLVTRTEKLQEFVDERNGLRAQLVEAEAKWAALSEIVATTKIHYEWRSNEATAAAQFSLQLYNDESRIGQNQRLTIWRGQKGFNQIAADVDAGLAKARALRIQADETQEVESLKKLLVDAKESKTSTFSSDSSPLNKKPPLSPTPTQTIQHVIDVAFKSPSGLEFSYSPTDPVALGELINSFSDATHRATVELRGAVAEHQKEYEWRKRPNRWGSGVGTAHH